MNKTSQSKKRRPLFSKNVLKVVPIHVYKFSFLIPRVHTEFLVIIFDRAKNRSSTLVWETRGDCCLKSLKEEQIILYSQHLPKKNVSLIASRKEKKYMKFVKMTFSCGNYNIFSCCLPETRTKDHIRGPRTIENGRLFSNSKQNIYLWNFKLQHYREEHKSYLSGSISARYVKIRERYSS